MRGGRYEHGSSATAISFHQFSYPSQFSKSRLALHRASSVILSVFVVPDRAVVTIVADHFSIAVSQDCCRQLRTVHGTHCKLICQRVFRTVGDMKEGRDLNEKTLGADNGRQQSSKEVSRVRVWCRQEGIQKCNCVSFLKIIQLFYWIQCYIILYQE